MNCLHRQMIQAAQRGDLDLAEWLREILVDINRHELAVKAREEKLRNIKFEDSDY